MTIRYEENRIYTAECNICGCLFTVEKNSQTDMELFMKNNGWEIWKSNNVHQPNCVCYNCKSMVESQIKKIGGGGMKLDINNEYHQLIIGACANLITEEGYTAREVLELLESAKIDLWSALKQIEIEVSE